MQELMTDALTVVIVVLARELLRAELVGGHDLAGALARHEVPVGVEHDLADEAVVGHHHRDGAEQRLEVVGQLRAAGVPACGRVVS